MKESKAIVNQEQVKTIKKVEPSVQDLDVNEPSRKEALLLGDYTNID